MSAPLAIGLPSTRHRWRRELHAHVRDHVDGVKLVVLQDSTDVLKAEIDAVVVDDTLDFLSAAQIHALLDQGIRVIGLYDGSRQLGRGRSWLLGLGVPQENTLAIDEPPSVLLEALALLDPGSWRRQRLNGTRPSGDVPTRGLTHGANRGRVVVVGGGSDSPGRTEVAAAIAGVLASQGESTLLVDMDEHCPGVAARLGYQLMPNVLDVLTVVRAGGDPATHTAKRAAFARSDVDFDVICGLANPADRVELLEVSGLFNALAARWRHVVVDTGATCAPDQTPHGGTQHGATRAAIRAADELVAVCGPTPLGVLRLLGWVADARELFSSDTAFVVAINRAPRHRFHRGELAAQISANVPTELLGELVFIDRDDAVEQAVWDAVPVRPGPFVDAVRELVGRFAPVARPRRRSFRRSALLGSRR